MQRENENLNKRNKQLEELLNKSQQENEQNLKGFLNEKKEKNAYLIQFENLNKRNKQLEVLLNQSKQENAQNIKNFRNDKKKLDKKVTDQDTRIKNLQKSLHSKCC